MKKQKTGSKEPVQEIVSLNDELFSFVTGDPLAALDARLAMVAGGGPTCDAFTCSTFGACTAFSCGQFKV